MVVFMISLRTHPIGYLRKEKKAREKREASRILLDMNGQ